MADRDQETIARVAAHLADLQGRMGELYREADALLKEMQPLMDATPGPTAGKVHRAPEPLRQVYLDLLYFLNPDWH